MNDPDQLFSDPLVARAALLIDVLRLKRATLSCAESCTGGMLSALVTTVAGASDVMGYGFVTYSNEAKMDLLGVAAELLDLHGAVSPQVAVAMAEGARARAGSTLALAVTGVAGPGGGSTHKPVGLVFIAIATSHAPTQTAELRLGDIGRSGIRLATTQRAIELALAACRSMP